MGTGPIAYQGDDGKWNYRLSAWGSCIRDLVAARRGIRAMPPSGDEDPWLREGHLHEGDVITQLSNDGWWVDKFQDRVELNVGSGKIIGHLDAGEIYKSGLMDDPRVLEVKALGKNTFAEVESMGVAEWVKYHQMYSWQVSGEMLSTGRKAIVVVKSRDSGKILLDEITEPPKSIADFEARMNEIDEWTDVDRLPPCEKTGFCWKGPYRHVHYKDTEPKAPIPIHETRDIAIEELTEKLHKARKKKAAAEQEEQALKEEFFQVTNNNEGVFITDRFKVTVQEVESTKMDTKAVRAEHGEKYDRKTSYRTIRIDHRD